MGQKGRHRIRSGKEKERGEMRGTERKEGVKGEKERTIERRR